MSYLASKYFVKCNSLAKAKTKSVYVRIKLSHLLASAMY